MENNENPKQNEATDAAQLTDEQLSQLRQQELQTVSEELQNQVGEGSTYNTHPLLEELTSTQQNESRQQFMQAHIEHIRAYPGTATLIDLSEWYEQLKRNADLIEKWIEGA